MGFQLHFPLFYLYLLPPPAFAVLSHGPSDLPDTQAPTHGGSIGASYFLIHCSLSIPLLCSKTTFGSLVLIHTSTRIISPFCLSSLVSDQSPTMLYFFSSSKIGLLTCPAYMLVSHLCTSVPPVLMALVSVLHDELFTARSATASLQLLPSLSLPYPFPLVLLFGYCVDIMSGVCSMYNPGRTTYWDK